MTFRTSKTSLSPPPSPTPRPPRAFPINGSKALHLLQFFIVCAIVVSYMAFVLSLFVPHLSFFGVLGRLCIRDCFISWVSSHIFN